MIVVLDTTPLITLMKVGRLGILGKLFGEVLIPRVANGRYMRSARPMSCRIHMLRLHLRGHSGRWRGLRQPLQEEELRLVQACYCHQRRGPRIKFLLKVYKLLYV